VLDNALVAWNIIRIGRLVEQLRAEGLTIDDTALALTTPLMHKHLNPFGRYQFNVARMRQRLAAAAKGCSHRCQSAWMARSAISPEMSVGVMARSTG
jgi:hypothetical protein